MPKEQFQGEWTSPVPEFTVAQLEVAGWSEGMHGPFVSIQQFPTEDWSAASTAQATEWVGRNTHRVVLSCSSTNLFFHKCLLNKMEIRLMKNSF